MSVKDHAWKMLSVAAFFLFLGASCTPSPIPIEVDNNQGTPTSSQSQIGVSCITEADCGADPKAWECVNGVCQFIPPPPADSQVCGSGSITWPCRNNQWCGLNRDECRDLPYCTVNSHCQDDQVCLNGYCGPVQENTQPDLPCISNDQCVSGKLCSDGVCLPADQVLPTDPVTGEILCNYNYQCWGGKVCVNQHCVLPADDTSSTQLPSSCQTDADCGGTKGVYCQNNTCVVAQPGNAATQKLCQTSNGQWMCEENENCGDKINQCFVINGSCQYDSQCSSQQYCSDGVCINKYSYTGSTCTTYSDCGSLDTYVCVGGRCATQAPGSKHCEDSISLWTCQNDNYECGSSMYFCEAHCSTNSECSNGKFCSQGICTSPPQNCTTHSQCLDPLAICQDNYCVWPADTTWHVCADPFDKRWHCPANKECGVKLFDCF